MSDVQTTKQCSKCLTCKPLSDFSSRPANRDGYQGSCKRCACDQQQARNRIDPSRTARNRRNSQLLNDYGISVDDYERMLMEQQGLCACCRQSETYVHSNGKVYALSVDHDHATGKIRGLLCHACNRAIGLLGDSVDRLQAAIDYLKAGE